jgi:hypothetical protein
MGLADSASLAVGLTALWEGFQVRVRYHFNHSIGILSALIVPLC